MVRKQSAGRGPDGEPTIVARIRDGHVILDPRTLAPHEEALIVDRLAEIAAGDPA